MWDYEAVDKCCSWAALGHAQIQAKCMPISTAHTGNKFRAKPEILVSGLDNRPTGMM